MKEKIVNDGFYQHIIICWQGKWYKIPFIVIQDEAEAIFYKSGKQIEDCPLSVWYMHLIYNNIDELLLINEFKKLFADKMPRMEAYLMYNVPENG